MYLNTNQIASLERGFGLDYLLGNFSKLTLNNQRTVRNYGIVGYDFFSIMNAIKFLS